MLSPTRYAAAVCALFASFGVVGFFLAAPTASLSLVGYYAVLVVNTFFSVKVFAGLTPSNIVQSIFDVTLALTYGMLALSFDEPVRFYSAAFALFVIAIGKYSHLIWITNASPLLVRKISINALGALLAAAAFAGDYYGFSLTALAFFLVFSLANVYVLLVNPMYRASD
jgi:hypothetical protein